MKSWFDKVVLFARSANRRRLERRHAHKGLTYADWVQQHDTLSADVLRALQVRMEKLPAQPKISVLMPVFNAHADWLTLAIDSVEQQIYPNWELCIADDRSTDPAVRRVLESAAARDPRIRVCWRAENGHISRASNSALEMATGEFVALLDHDDLLPAHALLMNAEVFARYPRTKLVYSDEDILRFDGRRQAPNFKPDWNPELFRSQNLICHLGVYSAALLRQIGGFRPGFEGAQDYDLALRCVELLEEDQIIHIPHILYHWRQHTGSSAAGDEVKPYIAEAGRRALQDHLDRIGLRAEVGICPGGGYRVVPMLPDPAPAVSVIVAAVADSTDMQRGIDRLLAGGASLRREVLISIDLDVAGTAPEWLSSLEASGAVRLIRSHGSGTAEALCHAASEARGDFLCLLDGDVEMASPDCLQEMVGLATVAGTGAVGAKLLHTDGSIAHGGFVLGAGQGVAPAHLRLGGSEHGYRGRAVLNQNLAAVSSACMVIRRSLFLSVDGFDSRFRSDLKAVDLCLRLRRLGLRTVWAAHARAVQLGEHRPAQWPIAEIETLKARWGDALNDDPAYNPNLDLDVADYKLAPQPRVGLKEPWFGRIAAATRVNSSCSAVQQPPAATTAAAERRS